MNKEAMNQKYAKPDPFGVKTNPADAVRKEKIISTLTQWVEEHRNGEPFERALDIGCGEGTITVDIPAKEIVGYDPSDIALSRVPSGTIVVTDNPAQIEGKFDCIIAAGVLVKEYDFKSILELIDRHASGIVLTCQTDVTEVHEVGSLQGKPISTVEFPYRSNKQRLRLLDYSGKELDSTGVTAETAGEKMTSDEAKDTDSDKTFKEIIDEAIDALPEGHDFDHLILSTEQHGQLMGESIEDKYRGFILEINDEEPRGRYEFYHRPESVDDELTEEEDSHGEHPDRDGFDYGGATGVEDTKSSL